ncbi:Ycf68 protein [Cucumis melo var. makuwa]|uniref:Ycf68 protein (Chloroplast) n=1 Tax=Cucumis melo var. makuwa TaxID=1194695 RepID=A0A5A7SRI9_CUCMM|nr:Ycf68 protein [Cucumis melo var. makuwa]
MVGAEGIFGGAMKCIEIEKNTNDESTLLGAVHINPCSAVANALSIPHGELSVISRRKVRMTSSHHDLYALGDIRAIMAGTKGCYLARVVRTLSHMDSSMCSSAPDPKMWIIQGTLAWRTSPV